jgi:hypothetical protein
MGKETPYEENSSQIRHIFSMGNVQYFMKSFLIIFVSILCCWSSNLFAQKAFQVQVQMKKYSGEYLNTFDSTYIPDPLYYEVKTIKIFFTEDEQKRIIKLADSLNFWELPDNLIPKDDSVIVMISHCPCPCSTRIKTKLKDKTVTADCFIANESYRTRLRELEYQIWKIVRQKSEYRALKPRH